MVADSAASAGAADHVGDGDRQRQHAEGDAALPLGQPEVVGDVGNSGDSTCSPTVADKYAPQTRANAPQWAAVDERLVTAPRYQSYTVCNCMETASFLDQSAPLDAAPPPRRRSRRRAARPARRSPMSSARPSPRGGRGEAATTQRVRAEAGGGMASAMAAVAPPYCGGKVYATHHGVFTFVNVLFDLEGRLLCTLDGDDAHPSAHAGRLARSRSATSPRPTPRSRRCVGAGRQGWPHLAMLAAELPAPRASCASTASSRPPTSQLVARAGRGRHPGVTAATTAADAVDGAEVVVTVTPSTRAAVPGRGGRRPTP